MKHTPLIGEITEMTTTDDGCCWLKICLWQGSYSGKWSCPKKPAVEWVTSQAVILYDFEFNCNGKLIKTTKDKLKELYHDYMNE